MGGGGGGRGVRKMNILGVSRGEEVVDFLFIFFLWEGGVISMHFRAFS